MKQGMYCMEVKLKYVYNITSTVVNAV